MQSFEADNVTESNLTTMRVSLRPNSVQMQKIIEANQKARPTTQHAILRSSFDLNGRRRLELSHSVADLPSVP